MVNAQQLGSLTSGACEVGEDRREDSKGEMDNGELSPEEHSTCSDGAEDRHSDETSLNAHFSIFDFGIRPARSYPRSFASELRTYSNIVPVSHPSNLTAPYRQAAVFAFPLPFVQDSARSLIGSGLRLRQLRGPARDAQATSVTNRLPELCRTVERSAIRPRIGTPRECKRD